MPDFCVIVDDQISRGMDTLTELSPQPSELARSAKELVLLPVQGDAFASLVLIAINLVIKE